MEYITINELNKTIRDNLWKIPRDIDFIITIPRSGSIAGSIISSYLNVPMIDIEGYIKGILPYGGMRLLFFKNKHIKQNKALVIDDTVANGTSMNNVKLKLMKYNQDIKYIYMCVFLEGKGENAVDIYLKDVRNKSLNFTKEILYEWNIFQHNNNVMKSCLYDIDGVLCVNPPDERNEKEYIDYIKNAKPLFIPRTTIGGIITYRLSKNKEITELWLKDNAITYNNLVMFNANSWEDRNNTHIPPEEYKGNYYKEHSEYDLFVESDDYQARLIARISNKAVYCAESNIMY